MPISFSKYFVGFLLLVISLSISAATKTVDVIILMEGYPATGSQSGAVVTSALGRLSEQLDSSSRIGLYTYSDKPYENIPLQAMTGSLMTRLGDTLKHNQDLISPRHKNPVSALEKAIYNLKAEERAGVPKIVLMFGDGEVSTGDPVRDQNLSEWLLGELSEETIVGEVAVYWLALSDAADFRVIQTLTRKSNGGYFRSFTPQIAISSVDQMLADVSGNMAITDSKSIETGNNSVNPIDLSIESIKDNHVLVLSLGAVVLVTLVIISILAAPHIMSRSGTRRRLRDPKRTGRSKSTVILRDLAGFTALKEYDITDKKTYVGRLPREVTERSTVVVIRDATVGREHAMIRQHDGAYWLQDNGTVNGTYLNHQRLSAEARLHDGDKIRFARFEFEFELPDEEITRDGGDKDYRKHKPIRIVENGHYEEEDKTVYRHR